MSLLNNPNAVLSFSQTAMQYGPFLFAMIFIVLVPPYAFVMMRRSYSVPQSDPERGSLLREGRAYFRCAWLFGMLLVICSISWWIYIQHFTIVGSSQYRIEYAGYITGLHQEDALRSSPPEEPPFLIQSKENDDYVYRFVYLSQFPLHAAIDLKHVSYINALAVRQNDHGVADNPVEFKLVPGETRYKFVIDSTAGKFMIVPYHWSPEG